MDACGFQASMLSRAAGLSRIAMCVLRDDAAFASRLLGGQRTLQKAFPAELSSGRVARGHDHTMTGNVE
jgi:hypothetical protein